MGGKLVPGFILVAITLVLYLMREVLHFDLAAYGHFAGDAEKLGIPTFWNVITNLGFVGVGFLGLRKRAGMPPELRALALVFSLSLIATAFGSAYFHWAPVPASDRLFWDQLPMSIGFGSFIGIIYADRVNAEAGKFLGLALCFLGPLSVWNIYYGSGAMEYYLGLQFGSLLFGIMMLMIYPRGNLKRAWVALGIFLYIAAKFLENRDEQIYALTGVGGHPLKHIVAALALAAIFRSFPLASEALQTPSPMTSKS